MSSKRVAKHRAVKKGLQKYFIGIEGDFTPVLDPLCDVSSASDESDSSSSSIMSSVDSPCGSVGLSEDDRTDGATEGVTDSQNDLQSQLSSWAIKHNITHAALNDLLALDVFKTPVPADARTLLKTCKVNKNALVEMQGIKGVGRFSHYGLKTGLQHILRRSGVKINSKVSFKLTFNVDGLPLFKSSSCQLWPILCRVLEYDVDPFVVSIYEGQSKPQYLNEFLELFIAELLHILNNGIEVNGITHDVIIHAFVCDAPARAFLKGIKGHNGHHGCERCVQKGELINNKLVFPEVDAELRSDISFREGADRNHHKVVSPLVKIDRLGLVSQFPLDYMHLVCLGVTRRLLFQWTKGSNKVRLGLRSRVLISERLRSTTETIPSEFNRRPRGLESIERWKATEFRTFLLYTGPVVLHNILPKMFYEHFLLLHVAMRLLCSRDMPQSYYSYANELLREFVKLMGKLYGPDSIVYNVHNLIHLTDDVTTLQGPLHDYSSFPFENFLGRLKRMIRSPNNPLGQISRRLGESQCNPELKVNKRQAACTKINVGGVTFSYTTLRDSFVMLEEQQVLKICDICCSDKDSIRFYGKIFRVCEEYFTFPCNSSYLKIFKVRSISERITEIRFEEIFSKCFVIPEKNSYIVVPLLQ